MRDLKMDEVPDFIGYLEKEGDREFCELVKEEFEFAKVALNNITFYDLVLVYYVGCLSSKRRNNYLQLARAEAVMDSELMKCVEAFKKHCVEGKKDD